MCNASRQQNSFSCVTHVTDKHFSVCNTYIGLLFSMCYTYIGLLLSMTCYCVRVGMRDANLNMFTDLFTCRLHVWNTVLLSASLNNMDSHAFQVPTGSTHLLWIPLYWIFFVFLCKQISHTIQ